MISSVDIQNAYVNLYVQLRKYIWSANVIEVIADLEAAVFETFPDMEDIRKRFKLLKSELYDVLRDDEEMQEVVDAFDKVISEEVGYSKINKVQEVL